MSREETLRALSEKSGIKARSESMAELREDFTLVWSARRGYGYISQDEHEDGKAAAGNEIKANAEDVAWIADVKAQYAESAELIRADKARRDRIAAEVKASRPPLKTSASEPQSWNTTAG